jgi:diguanylate cyclase (GGDEF)-like protein
MDKGPTNTILDGINSADIKSEQIRIIFSSIPASLLAILINSSILSVVLWDRIDHFSIIVWFLVTNCLSLFRWQLYRQFNRVGETRHSEINWYQLVVITTALSGATWGAAGIWLFSHQSIVHQVFLVFVIGGMCAGGITTLAAIPSAGRTFVLLAGIPIIGQFLLVNTDIANAMTIMSVLFMGMILASASRLNKTIMQTIVESLSSRRQQELAAQETLYQAHHDELTRLPNRRLLQETLIEEVARASRNDSVGAVLFIDIDRFKTINYSLGHIVGDDLIVQVANRLRSRLGPGDTAARLGGNEFVVILPEVGSNLKLASAPVASIADEFHKLLEAPYVVHGHDFHITTSIGIILFPLDKMNADDLIQYAEVAMYHARKDDQTDVRLFSEDMRDSINERRVIEKELQSAIENSEFELYFQSQFNSTDEIVGSEVLLRWNHPQRGVLLPAQFIEIAEQTGLIVSIGNWVLRTACEYQAILEPVLDLTISVRLSPRQFRDVDFINKLELIIDETQANPKKLKFEIPEAMLADNSERTLEILNQLKKRGISISVDNFGTGYSSFTLLHRLPIDELKIDQSFVRNIDTSADNAKIVDAIILMSRHLELGVVAKGVESPEEFDYLKNKQCNTFQGYLFQKPIPFTEFLETTID